MELFQFTPDSVDRAEAIDVTIDGRFSGAGDELDRDTVGPLFRLGSLSLLLDVAFQA